MPGLNATINTTRNALVAADSMAQISVAVAQVTDALAGTREATKIRMR